MTTRKLLCVLGLLSALLPAQLLAQEKKIVVSQEKKVVVFDMERAIMGTEVAKERLKALAEEEEYQEQRSSLLQSHKELGELQSMLEDADIMGDQRVAEVRKKMQGLLEDREYWRKKLYDQQAELYGILLKEWRPKVGDIITQMVDEDNLGVIFDQKVVYYADGELDITDKVTEKLNLER